MSTSFETDISILFNDDDVQCMRAKGVNLRSFDYMSDDHGDDVFADHANASHVLARLEGRELPQMPLGAAPWPPDKIDMIKSWMTDGYQP